MPSLFDPSDLGAPLRESVRAIGRFRNGLKYLTGEGPPVGLTPREVVWQRDKATCTASRATSGHTALPCCW
jgi:hypothetical protein